ncbi:MAG: 5-(carboxyamino)imidazole ribonucleotide synthase [Leptospiraceae bacterium]|nr:5-(carboxyamino)imidazole ribonucleotide synthase [Leptospiraceae bacterium]MDW8305535.1 5-(carboxyamino)imidazole ribonucleotide synthase [Leptospiraceae bacterium]
MGKTKRSFTASGARLGILGGGQLGRMLIRYAMDLNIHPLVLDPDPSCAAHRFAYEFTTGSLLDFETVCRFGRTCDVLTFEIENVNSQALAELVDEGIAVYPQPNILEIIQDKGTQKLFLKKHHIPTAPFFLVKDRQEAIEKIKDLPKVVKLRRSGYDGRGVLKIRDEKELTQIFDAPCVVEDFVPVFREIAVLLARNRRGECAIYPPVEQVFHPTKNILQYLRSPAQLPQAWQQRALALAQKIAEKLKLVGLLAVEMFVTQNGDIYVNELSPRPHNSGHHTIEANETSQYEQLLRCLFHLPLGDTSPKSAAVMVNLLGEPGYEGKPRYLGLEKALALKGVHVHLYGKAHTRPFRKMGHVTVTAPTLEEAEDIAQKILKKVKVVA